LGGFNLHYQAKKLQITVSLLSSLSLLGEGNHFLANEKGCVYMAKATLANLPDVLDARDIAGVMGIGYVKALRLVQYGGLPYIRIGRTYKVSKANFTDWLNTKKSKVIALD